MTATEAKPLTVKEAAVHIRLSPASVYALCAAKKLRRQRVGVGRGKILIPPGAVEEYLANGLVGAVGDATPPPLPPLKPRSRPKPLHVRMRP